MNKIDLRKRTSVDEDFALWAAEQASLLAAGKFQGIDVETIVAELEYLGNSQQSDIESRLNVLLTHLLKWQFQPERRSNSWSATLLEQRTQIARVIKRSPSLKPYPASVLDSEYEIALLKASGETNLPLSAFPEHCPYTIEEILDLRYFPGAK